MVNNIIVNKKMPETLNNLFEKTFNEQIVDCQPIGAAGSNRKYCRLKSENHCVIGVVGTTAEENFAFEKIAKHLYSKGLSVPKFLARSHDSMCYLQEDLGDISLFDYISQGRKSGVFSEKEKEILRLTISQLPAIQFFGAENFDFSVCYPQPNFDARAIMWDLNYFKYCFLKLQNIDFQENILENDFEKFCTELLQVPFGDKFMYRDFQSRNVMLKDGKPYFIDFQGARRGAIYYDLASFLWQASANFTDELKEELTQVYLQNLRKFTDFDSENFYKNLNIFALLRILQTLGAYGFRGLIEKKQHFIDSIEPAIKNLNKIVQNIENEKYPYLIKVLKQLTELERFKPKTKNEKLLVRIFSFSYKKGIPDDLSGNGGGFVFDCRAIDNPGKYLEYKDLTGLDDVVKNYLEKDKTVIEFLENCYSLAEKSITTYLKRGFTDLQISFGCTGGQHRSVFCAQKTAEYLQKKFDIEIDIELIHRELRD